MILKEHSLMQVCGQLWDMLHLALVQYLLPGDILCWFQGLVNTREKSRFISPVQAYIQLRCKFYNCKCMQRT